MKTLRIAVRVVLASLFVLPSSAGISIAQQHGPAPPDFLVTLPSSFDFDDTVDILKGAIEQENLMVVHEIDAQRMLRMVEVQTGGMKQILFFHPRYMKRIIELNRHGAIVPPLKIAVMEMPNGRVMVRYDRPTHLFEAYDGLSELAAELEGVIQQILDEIKD